MRQRGGDGTDEANALEFRGDVEVQQKASGEGWRLRNGVAGRRGEESGRSVSCWGGPGSAGCRLARLIFCLVTSQRSVLSLNAASLTV